MCRFSLRNEPSSIIDMMAMPLNDTLLSCVSPNVTNVWSTDDDYFYSTMSLISRGSSLPVSLSFPFMFKKLPAVKSISPCIGSSEGGTLVRVTGDGPGIWLNSSLLTCYFGEEKGEAKWIVPLVVDCITPAYQNISETMIFVSDNGVDLTESEATFSFHPDPLVTSMEPCFGLALNDTIVTLIGNGFSGREAPVCIFLEKHGRNLF